MTDKELFDAYKMDIYRTCFYMLKHKQDAEDLCHEIFIKIFQKDFNSIEKLKPWILSIIMNECRNYLKKKVQDAPIKRLRLMGTEYDFSGKSRDTSREK